MDEVAARVAAEGMTHLALTDTNALYGAVAFAKACREVGVQPILGMTATVAPMQDARAIARYVRRRKGCFACPIRCGRVSRIENGPYAGDLEGPEYETLNALGPMCGVDDAEASIIRPLLSPAGLE